MIKKPNSITHWSESNIDNYYEFPAGFAGSRFLRRLKEEGVILASRCRKCGVKELPPRAWCPECFGSDVEYVEAGLRGVLHTFTVSHTDLDGSRLKEPILWGLVKFEGVKGGLLHRLGGVEAGEVRIGMKVEAVLRPRKSRLGSILDIQHFKPAKP